MDDYGIASLQTNRVLLKSPMVVMPMFPATAPGTLYAGENFMLRFRFPARDFVARTPWFAWLQFWPTCCLGINDAATKGLKSIEIILELHHKKERSLGVTTAIACWLMTSTMWEGSVGEVVPRLSFRKSGGHWMTFVVSSVICKDLHWDSTMSKLSEGYCKSLIFQKSWFMIVEGPLTHTWLGLAQTTDCTWPKWLECRYIYIYTPVPAKPVTTCLYFDDDFRTPPGTFRDR